MNKVLLSLLFLVFQAMPMQHRVGMKKMHTRHNMVRICKTGHQAGPDCMPAFRSKCTELLPQVGGWGTVLLLLACSGILVDQVQSAPIRYLKIGTDKDCENLPFKDWRWCCRTEMLPDEDFVVKRCMRRDGKINSSALFFSTAATQKIRNFKKEIPYE